jgi:hypothetical protein
MARAEMSLSTANIDFTIEEYYEEFSYFFDSLLEKREAIAGTFSPSRELCGSGHCVSQIGGSPLYFDNAHLSYSLSPFWENALVRQLPTTTATAHD